jgi:hypothetical protein
LCVAAATTSSIVFILWYSAIGRGNHDDWNVTDRVGVIDSDEWRANPKIESPITETSTKAAPYFLYRQSTTRVNNQKENNGAW